ncbi:hypothetical protein [Staphylococcus casei]|uniref:Uncharacterized protein n=1 Tax=Staphylococcus casei TaxID=201828 RepID=A0ABZ2WCY3_9STAP
MSDIAIDTFSGMVPIIGYTISGYRETKAIKNQSVFINVLCTRIKQ